VARRCGDNLEARGHETCGHRDRQLRSASESSHRAAGCHRAGHHFLRAPVPTHATSVPFLVPSLGRALGQIRVRALHNCRCQVPSVDGYESGWAPWSSLANESATWGSAMPVAAVKAVVTGRDAAHTHWSDVHVVRVLKDDTQADIHGTWET